MRQRHRLAHAMHLKSTHSGLQSPIHRQPGGLVQQGLSAAMTITPVQASPRGDKRYSVRQHEAICYLAPSNFL
ncbi:MAG: hypothetical protein IPN40_13795 [Uliginosibacterium sp.]|nr:hypothetical protein [Uliginosibacterium sp.]